MRADIIRVSRRPCSRRAQSHRRLRAPIYAPPWIRFHAQATREAKSKMIILTPSSINPPIVGPVEGFFFWEMTVILAKEKRGNVFFRYYALDTSQL